jgi:UDP-4-amino-4,6-dideoxy-N-acetyl-beta-L-altrosamine N-acetyltransferase
MLEGKKVNLVSVKKENLEKLRTWRNRPDLKKYFREYRTISPSMQNEWFKKINEDRSQVNFEIRDKTSNSLIGHCGLHYISWINRHAEFGIYVGDPNFRSGGFGSDALRTLIRYGFEELNLNKIWCEVYANNTALDIYRHIGFKDEGVLRQHYFNEGKYWDSYNLSLLREDYK